MKIAYNTKTKRLTIKTETIRYTVVLKSNKDVIKEIEDWKSLYKKIEDAMTI